MNKRVKLRPYVLPSLYLIIIMVFAISSMQTFEDVPQKEEKMDYVSNGVLTDDIPVVSTNEIVIIRPYIDNEVKIGRNFYDYQSDEDNQKNSIVYYENTYIQNSGIDYVKQESFDVVSILDGTVISVNSNEFLGNTIEIKHDKNLISVYQSLSNILVKISIPLISEL